MSADSIRNDPFARFERSRGGFLIFVALFIVGASVTVWAVGTLARLEQVDERAMLRAKALQIKKDQRAHAIAELRGLIQHLQTLTPEEQQEFLKNNPQIKISRQPASPTPNNLTPETARPEIATPETQAIETSQP